MKLIRAMHKWAALVVGVQFILWLGSGLYFNLMDHQQARGHTYRAHSESTQHIEFERLVEPKTILLQHPSTVEFKQIWLLEQPYYLLTHSKGLYRHFENHYTLVDAFSGETVRVDREFASSLANQSYAGPGSIQQVRLLAPPLEDFPKQANPTWRVDYSDDIATSVYVEAGSGRIVGHSDDHKRLADVFFMLHFMDYGGTGSFNTWQIIIFALGTLWLVGTGVIWTVDGVRKGQYRLK